MTFTQDNCQGPVLSLANQDEWVRYSGESQIFNIVEELLVTVPLWPGALGSSKMRPTLGFGGEAAAVRESYKETAVVIFLLCNLFLFCFCGSTNVSAEALSVFKGHRGRGTAFLM